MIEIIKVLKLKKLGRFRRRVYFSDGTEGEWDFAHMTSEGGTMIEPLKNPKYFARVSAAWGAYLA